MHSTHTAELPIHGLPREARQAHVFPDLNNSLLAIAPLCDHGCEVTFTKSHCTITLPTGNEIWRPRNADGLWVVPPAILANLHDIPPPAPPATESRNKAAPAITRNASTPADLVAFAHAALFSPAISTLKKALRKGFLPPFTGLTETTLHRYSPSLEATAMGHLDAQRKNTRSTKLVDEDSTLDQDYFPPQPTANERTNTCFLTTTEPKHVVYSDKTGRLPQPSSNGNNYLVVAYDFDSNSILMRAKQRTVRYVKTIHNLESKTIRLSSDQKEHKL